MRKSKYGAQKTLGYDSRKEAARAAELRLLQYCGKISNLQEQVRFEVIPAQKDEAGKTLERATYYIADFVYNNETGDLVVEDTKGFRTAEYVMKRKLMLYVHGIRVKET